MTAIQLHSSKGAACKRFFPALALALLVSLAALAGCASSAGTAADASTSSASESSLPAAGDGQIAVSLEVNSDAADGSVAGTEQLVLEEGSSALDALQASSFDAEVQDSEWGSYVDAINGIGTGDFGDMSGWIFELNGESVMVSAGECILSDGDALRWSYVS